MIHRFLGWAAEALDRAATAAFPETANRLDRLLAEAEADRDVYEPLETSLRSTLSGEEGPDPVPRGTGSGQHDDRTDSVHLTHLANLLWCIALDESTDIADELRPIIDELRDLAAKSAAIGD